MVTQLMFHSWGIQHSKPGNQGFRRTAGETGGSGWGWMYVQAGEGALPLQNGHWGGPLSQVHLLEWGLAQAQEQVVQRKNLLGLRLLVTSLEL